MKNEIERLTLGVVLLLGLGLTRLQAQTIYVKEVNGTLNSHKLGGIRKMTFSEGNTNI